MKKSVWVLIASTSLIISVAINFNSEHLGLLFFKSTILGAGMFGLSVLIVKLIQNLMQKTIWKAILFAGSSILFFLLFSTWYLLTLHDSLCSTTVTPYHFRTNIITGQCDFGGGNPCLVSDPWYYISGCDISDYEKIEVLKASERYERLIESCSAKCRSGSFSSYCRKSPSGNFHHSELPSNMSCEDLTSCDAVFCEE